jgi:glucose-6-phosphate-specific signal transduction histidine kinase
MEVSPMSDTVMVALLSLFGSLVGTLGGIAINSKLSNYRIEQLEKKVDKHNNLIERMFRAEEAITVLDEKMKVANHRIDDLEDERKD